MTPDPGRSRSGVESTASRPRFVSRTEVVAFIIGAAIVVLADKAMLSLPERLGSDWGWYRDGPFRLAAGLPLYDVSMLRGPFEYPGGQLIWNQAPWALALIAPFALLPDAIQLPAWLAFMDGALLVGLALIWPRSTTPVLLFVATITAISSPFLMGMTWGNLQSVATLGIGLFMFGYRKRSHSIMGVGIAVAATKLVPALPLIAFVVFRLRQWRPLSVAGILLCAATIPVLIRTSSS